MRSRALINSLPIRSDDVDFFAADASELYRHAKQRIFLLLIIGGECVLVHDDNRSVRPSACHREIWQHLFDSSDEAGFPPRKIGRVPARHNQHLSPFQNIPSSLGTQAASL